LQWIACLGASVETALLVRILGRAEGEVHASLRPAVLAGMVIPGGGQYRILHDRIQEVAYSLIPEPRRSDMHLAIGRRLLDGRAPEAETVAEGLFLLADQFNRGLARIDAVTERDVVRRLNTLAGRKAMVSAAYGSASIHLALARSVLPAEAWERDYPETLAQWMDGAESDFMAGLEGRAEALLGEIQARALPRVDRAKAFLLRVRVYQALGRYPEAVEACLEGMRILGATIPPADAESIGTALAEASLWVRSVLGQRRLADLADAPAATGQETSVFVALAAEAVGPAALSQTPYFPLLVLLGVRATLEYGPVADSAFIYSVYAFLLAAGDEPEMAQEFSDLPLRLYGRLGGVRARGALLFARGGFRLWRYPPAEGAAILEEAVLAAERVGDVTTLGNAAVTALWARLEAGESLASLAEAAGTYLAMARGDWKLSRKLTLRRNISSISLIRLLRAMAR
jgi:predicted ATPase